MVDHRTFELMKAKYGHYASWAVWAESNGRPKDNVGDLRVFDLDHNHDLLDQLNANIVLVGLNISRKIQAPLGNFHDPRPASMDFKLRHALAGTQLWGAYMTDIIKDFEQLASGDTMAYVRKNRGFEQDNIDLFRSELEHLGVTKPTLIALGRDAHEILSQNLGGTHHLLKATHYSHYISKEDYRKEITTLAESIPKTDKTGQVRFPQ